MNKWFRKYWVELLAFGAIFGVLLMCCIPDITWINTDCDGPHYIYSAKYLYPAHKTSAPLFLLLGNLFLRLPFATEAWRISLLSVLATMGTCTFIYLAIKQHTSNKWYSLAGVLTFGSSALLISQSTIVESYALTTMFGAAAYYFSIKKKWVLTALMLGAGGAVHHLIGIPIVVLLIVNKELRQWRYLGIMACFLLFYAYIPLSKYFLNPPNMWGNMGLQSFFTDNLTTALMLIGGLSIWDLPKRIFDALGILGVSFTLALVPLAIALKQWKKPLFWLFVLPIIYFISDLSPQTYVYIMPSIAAGAVLVGIGLARMKLNWTWAVIGAAILMLGFNAVYFDVGRTLDPELSARKFYDEELSKVPDGEILMAQQGWEWAIVFPYNKDEGRKIVPVCVGTLASPGYRDVLNELGVKFTMPANWKKMTLGEIQNAIAMSIVHSNENVWTTQPTTPRTYGAKIVHAIGQESELAQVPKSITGGEMDMIWRWKPHNPYDIITGAIEVEDWTWLVFSNYSVLLFTMLGTIGAVPVWIGYMLIVKRKKWSFRKVQEVVFNA
ncbi:MAG: DUF2723 domain-containing protein [Proteobacteria bacterium]|nr:DUF2723 domain-containing protein [Pseudomonadota bacterium]